ncbi:MAG: hypothetical protein H6716_23525 [Polyangiaceae bacterium]|nr:hypothetical protein [Polyangiaceae bacterium]
MSVARGVPVDIAYKFRNLCAHCGRALRCVVGATRAAVQPGTAARARGSIATPGTS